MNIISTVMAIVILVTSGAVGAQAAAAPEARDLQRYALLEVYSPEGDLLRSWEDATVIADYLDYMSHPHVTEATAPTTPQEVLFTLVSYRTPAALINNGVLERQTILTVYRDSSIIRADLYSGVVGNPWVPEVLPPVWGEAGAETLAFLHSLAEAA